MTFRGIVELHPLPGSDFRRALIRCAEECDRRAAHHEHCRICADVCRRCKAACDEVLAF